MTRTITNIMSTMLMLIGLYLVLRFGGNASKVIDSLATGVGEVFTVLQGRSTVAPRRKRARA